MTSFLSKEAVSVEIPDPININAEFVYNFYTRDERVSPPKTVTQASTNLSSQELPLDKISRYVTISWTRPVLSDYQLSVPNYQGSDGNSNLTLKNNSDKIVSEDDFFNPGFINHTFSNVDIIEQGSSDLENFSRISRLPSLIKNSYCIILLRDTIQ